MSVETMASRDWTRLKPNVHCGSTEYATQPLVEYLSNSVDIHVIGFGNVIELARYKDDIYSIRDYGKGINISEVDEEGKTELERAYSVEKSSGKFREDGEYKGTSLGAFGM